VDPKTGAKLVFGVFRATAFPAGPEICDGFDNNGDGSVDDGLRYCINGTRAPNTDGVACLPGFTDANGDPADGCEGQSGTEVCDGVDNDGDGVVDDGLRYCINGNPAPNTNGSVCDAGFLDLDGDAANGCEVQWTPNLTVTLPNPVLILDGFRGQPPAEQQGQVMSVSGPIPGLEANVECVSNAQPSSHRACLPSEGGAG
jgi:hypothetical protein